MNIIIIPSWYRNEKQPNNGSFFRQQAKAIANRGNNVIVLDASLRVKKGWFSKACMRFNKSKDDNITIYSYNFPSLFFGRFPLLYAFIYKLSLEYLLKKVDESGFKADIIHAHSAYAAGFAVIKSKRLKSIPRVVTEHNSIFNRAISKKSLQYILKETVEKSDKFICVSEQFANNIRINLGKSYNISIIPNMINNIFSYRPRIKKDDFVFLSVGNLVKIKRMDMLIKAFTSKFSFDKNIQLRIVGVGDQQKELENLISILGMHKQIKLLGELTQEKLLREYELCDAFVLASVSETFGLAYREALAVGRPIISTLNGGITEEISQLNGKFLENDSQECLSDALEFMVNNIDSFDKQFISNRCIEKYSPEVVVGSILHIYSELLDKD